MPKLSEAIEEAGDFYKLMGRALSFPYIIDRSYFKNKKKLKGVLYAIAAVPLTIGIGSGVILLSIGATGLVIIPELVAGTVGSIKTRLTRSSNDVSTDPVYYSSYYRMNNHIPISKPAIAENTPDSTPRGSQEQERNKEEGLRDYLSPRP